MAETEKLLTSLNHVSFLCRSADESAKFYKEVLEFDEIKRPSSLNFKGAWLRNKGIGLQIHLIERDNPDNSPHPPDKTKEINPRGCHIAFQCSNLDRLEKKLEEKGVVNKVRMVVPHGDVNVDQLFFHDPDGCMIEICNCENIKVVELSDNSPSGDSG